MRWVTRNHIIFANRTKWTSAAKFISKGVNRVLFLFQEGFIRKDFCQDQGVLIEQSYIL